MLMCRALIIFALLTGALACGPEPGDGPWPEEAQRCEPGQRGLVITELLPNPMGPDGGREWLEIFNSTDGPLCLEGSILHIGVPWAPKSRVLRGLGCMPPKALWVLADGATSPGAPPPYLVQHRYGSLAMPNAQGVVALSCGGVTWDAVEYGTSAVPGPQEGRALARVPMEADAPFCLVSTLPDPAGNMGSPGLANPACDTCWDEAQELLRPVRGATLGALEMVHLVAANKDAAGALCCGALTVRTKDFAVDLAGLMLEGLADVGPARRWHVPPGQCWPMAPHTTLRLPLADEPAANELHLVGKKRLPRGLHTLVLHQGTQRAICEAAVQRGALVPAAE